MRVAAVIVILAVIATAAVVGFVQASAERNRAQANLRTATAQKLNAQAQGMLAGTAPGGDARAFQQILAARDRRQAGITAPPQGLFLVEVRY